MYSAELLKEALFLRGRKFAVSSIAEAIEVSYPTAQVKLHTGNFTISEAVRIAEKFNLSDEEYMDIFYKQFLGEWKDNDDDDEFIKIDDIE